MSTNPSKIDYAIAKLNELSLHAKGTAESEELDIIACDAAAELAQLRANSGHYIKGGDGSHWVGCEETHYDCKIVKLEKENAELRAATAEAEKVIALFANIANDEPYVSEDKYYLVYILKADIEAAVEWMKKHQEVI